MLVRTFRERVRAQNFLYVFSKLYICVQDLQARCLKLWKLTSPTLKAWWDKTSEFRGVLGANLIELQKKLYAVIESSKILESDLAKSIVGLENKSETFVLKLLSDIEWTRDRFGNRETASFIVFAVSCLQLS